MLVGEEDVPVVAENEISDFGNHAFAVGTTNEQNGRVFHHGLCGAEPSPATECAVVL